MSTEEKEKEKEKEGRTWLISSLRLTLIEERLVMRSPFRFQCMLCARLSLSLSLSLLSLCMCVRETEEKQRVEKANRRKNKRKNKSTIYLATHLIRTDSIAAPAVSTAVRGVIGWCSSAV